MRETCFKVVLNKNGKLVSPFMSGKAQVTYVLSQPAVSPEFLKTKGYGLTVFTSLEHAIEFLTHVEWHGELWECACTEITDKLPRSLDFQALATGQFHPGSTPWAKGTKMASTVVLTRKVGINEHLFYVPVTPHGQKWQGVGKNEGLVFDPTSWFVITFRGRLIFGYLTSDEATRVSPFVLKGTGIGILIKSTASVALAEGEAAARGIRVIGLREP